LGWYGNIQAIPELINSLDDPQYARLSAAAIYTITGAKPERTGWVGENRLAGKIAEKDEYGFPIIDKDVALSWPDKTLFSQWWHRSQSHFDTNQSYLAGRAITDSDGLHTVMQVDSLALGYLAALRLSIDNPLLTVMRSFPAYQQIKEEIFKPGAEQ